MTAGHHPLAAPNPDGGSGEPGGADLDRAIAEVPRGALALAGSAVALLLLCWLAMYLFVFIPRGMVG